MSYRESANDGLRFSDRQLRWIHATTTEEVVRGNLRGLDPGPAHARDGVGEGMLWGGILVTGASAIGAIFTASLLAAVPLIPGIVVAGAAVQRLKRAAQSFAIDIVTVAPAFEDGWLVVGDARIAWPEKLRLFASELAESEQLRIGLVTRDELRYVGWAYPV